MRRGRRRGSGCTDGRLSSQLSEAGPSTDCSWATISVVFHLAGLS